LVIDDDATFCGYLAEVLRSLGHEAAWVTDGLVGFDRCLREPFDLVICDVRMPLILGTELLAELRRDRPDLEIVLISAFADDRLASEARRHHARLLSKPFDAALLERTLHEVADHPAAHRKEYAS
jgi:CheY-like chemotaxis protein